MKTITVRVFKHSDSNRFGWSIENEIGASTHDGVGEESYSVALFKAAVAMAQN